MEPSANFKIPQLQNSQSPENSDNEFEKQTLLANQHDSTPKRKKSTNENKEKVQKPETKKNQAKSLKINRKNNQASENSPRDNNYNSSIELSYINYDDVLPFETVLVEKLDSGQKDNIPKGNKDPESNNEPKNNLSPELQKEIIWAIIARKSVRVGILLLYLLVLALGIIFWMKSILQTDKIVLDPKNELEFRLDNCTLLITESKDTQTQNLFYIEYQVSKGLGSNKTRVFFDDTNSTKKLKILNEFEEKYCFVTMVVDRATKPKSIKIDCIRCKIVQDTSFQFEINGTLTIMGKQIEANFRNLKVQTFNYEVNTGYLQLNNIESSSNNTITTKTSGDIIIQSIQDFKIDLVTDTEAYCLNAPAVKVRDITNCQTINGTDKDDESTSNNPSYWDNYLYYWDYYDYFDDNYYDNFFSGVYNGQQDTSYNSEYATYSNGSCGVIFDLCNNNASCKPQVRYKIKSVQGNVYGNIIPEVGNQTLPDSTLKRSSVYKDTNGDDLIRFDSAINATIAKFNEQATDQSAGNVFARINTGSLGSQSSKLARWVVSSTPSYSLMKPWWIGTFAATILNSKIVKGSGGLLPGFCPFVPEYSQQDLLKIQNLINSNIHTPNKLTTFVYDEELPQYPPIRNLSKSNFTGIFQFAKNSHLLDKWLSLSSSEDGTITLEDNNYTMQMSIVGAIILSIFISFMGAYFMMELVIYAINSMYYKLIDLTRHLEMYKKEQAIRSNNKNHFETVERELNQERKYTFMHIIKNVPSPASFLEYLSYILSKQFTSSAEIFYHALFKEAEFHDDDDEKPDQNKIRGTVLKTLYETFCFVNHLTEEKLTDEYNKNILESYGFTIIDSDEFPIEVFKKIKVKKHEAFRVQIPFGTGYPNIFELFFKENVDITEFEEDQIETAVFMKIFDEFCILNNVDKTPNTQVLAELDKRGIQKTTVSQKFIMRQEDDGFQTLELNLLLRIKKRILDFFSLKKKNKKYIIDKSQLEQEINLSISDLSDTKNQSSLKRFVLFKYWWVWDLLTVFFHLFLIGFFTLPFMGIAVLNETQYQPWSLKNRYELISFNDFRRAPDLLFKNLYTQSFWWNKAIVYTATLLWAVGMFDLLAYYIMMPFPQDKIFTKKKRQESLFRRLFTGAQWLLVLLVLSIYFGYFVLVSIWLLMGAFINPNAFLPFATASMTLLTFLYTKYRQFKNLANQGLGAIKKQLTQIFNEYSNRYLAKAIQKLDKLSEGGITKAVSIVQNEKFEKITNKLVGINYLDPKLLTQFKNKIGLLQGYVSQEDKEEANEQDVIVNNEEILSFPDAMKEDVATKVKQEGVEKGVPKLIMDLNLALTLKEESRVEITVEQIITELVQNNTLTDESGKIISQLLFTSKFEEEQINSISNRIFKMILEKKGIVQDLTPEKLQDIFLNLDNKKVSAYCAGIRKLLVKDSTLERYDENENRKMKLVVQLIELAMIMTKKNEHYPELKNCYLDLLDLILDIISKDENDKRIALLNLLSIIFAKNEIAHDVKNKEPFQNFNVLKLTDNLFGRGDKNVSDIIYLALCYAKDEIYNLSDEVINNLKQNYLQDNNKKELVPFLFKFTNIAFDSHVHSYQRIYQCISDSSLEKGLKEFCRVLTCYPLSDELCSLFNITINKENSYLNEIAHKLGLNTNELTGFINLLYNKKGSEDTHVFLKALMKKIDNNITMSIECEHVINLLFWDDETEILKAAKALKLKHFNFFLIGKGLLDPKYVSRKTFENIGVANTSWVLKYKDKVYESNEIMFGLWKTNIVEEIDSYIKSNKNDKTKQEVIKNGRIVMSYLKNLQEDAFSKEDMINLLKNIENDGAKDIEKQMASAQDFLMTVLLLKNFKLSKGKRIDELTKAKEDLIDLLAEYFNEDLKIFLKMFLMNDKKCIQECLFHFFPNHRKKQDTLERILEYCFREVEKLQCHIRFIEEDLPKYLQTHHKVNVTSGLAKLFIFGPKINLSVKDILDMSTAEIKKLADDTNEAYFESILKLALWKNCLISEDDKKILKISNKKSTISKLFDIFTQSNQSDRANSMSQLINEKSSMNVFLQMYAFCNHIIIRSTSSNKKQKKKDTNQKSVKKNLADILRVHPWILNLLEVAFRCDESQFFQKSLTLNKNYKDSSKKAIENKLMEILFKISLGSEYDTNYLAEKFDVSSDILDFFMIIRRLRNEKTREDTVNKEILKSSPVKNVFSRLRIDCSEFFNLLRIIFDFSKEVKFEQVISQLGLTGNNIYNDNSKDIDSIRKIVLSSNYSEFDTFRKPPKILQQISKEESHKKFQKNFILNLAVGNYSCLRQNEVKNKVFSKDNREDVINMTMALCGLLNSNLEVYVPKDSRMPVLELLNSNPKVDNSLKDQLMAVSGLINNVSKDPPQQMNKAPSNLKGEHDDDVPHAIDLAYSSIGIPRSWARAFLFDEAFYSSIEKNVKRINKEFVLAIVMNFINLPDFFGDWLGLYEWFSESLSPPENERNKNKKMLKIFSEEILAQKITFEYDNVKKYAEQLELLDTSCWSEFFKDSSTYNIMINKSIIGILNDKNNLLPEEYSKLLEVKNPEERNKQICDKLKISPYILLNDIVQNEIAKNKNSGLEPNKILGKLIKRIIIGCYKILTHAKEPQVKQKNHRLTDLCILGTIGKLRNRLDLEMTYNRILYNLHQLVMNVERKMYLNEKFWKMDKFKIIQLAGVSLGVHISNNLEKCLPPSLFNYSSFENLKESDTEEVIANIKKKIIEVVDEERLENVGDLGLYEGSFQIYFGVISTIIRKNDWKSLESTLSLSKKYSKLDHNESTAKTKPKQEEKDLRDFEDAFIDPDVNLWMSKLTGFCLLFEEETKDRKNDMFAYLALASLQSWRMKGKFSRNGLKGCIKILSSKLKSNMKHLEELLVFIITKNGSLEKTLNTLKCKDDIFTLSFFSFDQLKEQEDIIKNIFKNRLGSRSPDFKQLKLLKLLNEAFNFDKKSWGELIKQSTNDPKYKNDSHLLTLPLTHPLIELIELLNFEELKTLTKDSHKKSIISFIPKEQTDNLYKKVFIEVIKRSRSTDKKIRINDAELEVLIYIFLGTLEQKFELIFEKWILPASFKPDEKYFSLEQFFGPLDSEEVKSLKTFCTLAAKDLYMLKQKSNADHSKNYDKVIDEVEKHIKGLSLFNGKKEADVIISLFLGSITHDIERILTTLNRPEDGNLLYSIYGMFNYGKLLTEKDKVDPKLPQRLVLELTKSLEINNTKPTEQDNNSIKIEDLKNIITISEEINIQKISPLKTLKSLVIAKTRPDLGQIANSNNETKPLLKHKSLLEHVCNSFSASSESTQLQDGKISCSSICDASILLKLSQIEKSKDLNGSIKFILNLNKILTGSNSEKNDWQEVSNNLEDFKNLLKTFLPDEIKPILPFVSIMFEMLKEKQTENEQERDEINYFNEKVFPILKHFLEFDELENDINKKLVCNLLTIALGVDINDTSKTNIDPKKRREIYFNEILRVIFPRIGDKMESNDFEKIYQVSSNLKQLRYKDFKEAKKYREFTKPILQKLAEFNIWNPELVNALLGSLEGKIDQIKNLAVILNPKKDQEPENKFVDIEKYMKQTEKVLNLEVIDQLSSSIDQLKMNIKKRKKNLKDLDDLRKKVEEGKASTLELFKLADQEGDSSGSISEKEFIVLARRLGINLTEHRVAEIFSKIKLNSKKQDHDNDLNEKEFEQALDYLKEKNSLQALKLLNITPEMLTAILIRLVVMLILIFIFIFLGITAFGAGGTFGSIVSSAFPILGGVTLSKKNDSDEKLEEKNINQATETGFEIIASNDI